MNADEKRRSAQDPSASASVLHELYSDYALRADLAKNPNTPPPLLAKLAELYTEELLENPSFELLLLERPDWLDTFSHTALESFCRMPRLPRWLILALAQIPGGHQRGLIQREETTPELLRELMQGSTEARRVVAMSPRTPPELLRELAEAPRKKFFDELASNPSTPKDVLHQMAQQKGPGMWRLASNPSTSLDTLALLSKQREPQIRRCLLQNPNTPPALQHKLFSDKNIRGAITENPNASAELLKVLAVSYGEKLYAQIARHPNTPLEVLDELFLSPNYNIKVSVALHPKAPIRMLEEIATYANPEERINVAKNPNTPLPLLEKLSRDPFIDVRYEIAKLDRSPDEWLERLRQDEDKHVQRAAAETLSRKGSHHDPTRNAE